MPKRYNKIALTLRKRVREAWDEADPNHDIRRSISLRLREYGKRLKREAERLGLREAYGKHGRVAREVFEEVYGAE
ncbi:MAG: hypothetical protein QXX12_05920 [Nanopusillaceae archaeon]